MTLQRRPPRPPPVGRCPRPAGASTWGSRRRSRRVVAVVATPAAQLCGAHVVHESVRLRGVGPQVLHARRPVHRTEEAIREREPPRVRPVVGDLALPVLDVAAVLEAVHRAAVHRGDPVDEAVAEVALGVRGPREGDLGAVARHAARRAVGAREATEHRVERPVLLDEEHHVVDVCPRGLDQLRVASRADDQVLHGGVQVGRIGAPDVVGGPVVVLVVVDPTHPAAMEATRPMAATTLRSTTAPWHRRRIAQGCLTPPTSTAWHHGPARERPGRWKPHRWSKPHLREPRCCSSSSNGTRRTTTTRCRS